MSMTDTTAAGSDQQAFIVERVHRMRQVVQQAVRDGQAAHTIQERIVRGALEIDRSMLQLFFELRGDGDLGERVLWPDGEEVRRRDKPHTRMYRRVFGDFELERRVYGTREGQKILYRPLDARLHLPASNFSYVLQDWDQALEVEMPAAGAQLVRREDAPRQGMPVDAATRREQPFDERQGPGIPQPVRKEPHEDLVIHAGKVCRVRCADHPRMSRTPRCFRHSDQEAKTVCSAQRLIFSPRT